VRIALISDLHGNQLALDAVLADARRAAADRIVCLGDVATLGPRPREVIRTLRELGCPCIMGNHDAFLLDPELIHAYTEAPVVVESVDWCRGAISADDLEFLSGFLPSLEIALGDGATLLLYHGSPRSHMEDILSTTPVAQLDEALDGRSAAVMAGGHTHVQMMRQHRGTLIVNPGSVGMPFREYVGGGPPTILAHAEYATVESVGGGIEVRLRRVALDRAALGAAAAAGDFPLRDSLVEQYR
jgi:predicted phosphodiesterase